MLHTLTEPFNATVCCAVLGSDLPVLNHVEVHSRWETGRRGTHELSVSGESYVEGGKGDDAAEGAGASSARAHPEPAVHPGGGAREDRKHR